MYNKNSFDGYHYVRFGVKPTEQEKTQIEQRPTYDGWVIFEAYGSVYSAIQHTVPVLEGEFTSF